MTPFDHVPTGALVFFAVVLLVVAAAIIADLVKRRRDGAKQLEEAAEPKAAPSPIVGELPGEEPETCCACGDPATVRRGRLEVRRTLLPGARGDHAAFPSLRETLPNPLERARWCRRCALRADAEAERLRGRLRQRLSEVSMRLEDEVLAFEAGLPGRIVRKDQVRVRTAPTPIRRRA